MAGHPMAMAGPWMGGPMGGPGIGPSMGGHMGGLGLPGWSHDLGGLGGPGMGGPGMSGPGMGGGSPGMMGPGIPMPRMDPVGGGLPSDNIYVTGLPAGSDERMVRYLLSPYASVTQCKMISSGGRGEKASAFIRFMSTQQAAWVVQNMNGAIPQGLSEPIFARFADAPEPKPSPFSMMPGGARCGGGAFGHQAGELDMLGQLRQGGPAQRNNPAVGGRPVGIMMIVSGIEASGVLPGGARFSNNESTLYVAGLTPDTRDIHLYQLFAPFGAISAKGVRAVANPDGTCKGFGFVNFLEPESVQNAINAYNGAILPDGTVMKVAVKTPKSTVSSAP